MASLFEENSYVKHNSLDSDLRGILLSFRKHTNDINKTWNPTELIEEQTRQPTDLRGNHSRHHNTGLNTWRHVTGQIKQWEPH